MPKSKLRKKKGKAVKKGTLRVDPNKESNVTLQDLINVYAYQEYVKDGTINPKTTGFDMMTENQIMDFKDGTIVSDDVKVHIPEIVPVTIKDKDGNKRVVGTASPIPGDEQHLSVHVTDLDIRKAIQGRSHFSIDKENNE